MGREKQQRYWVLPLVRALTALVAVSVVFYSQPAIAQTTNSWSQYIEIRNPAPPYVEAPLQLAVDINLPQTWEEGDRVPALLHLTRYWRSSINTETGEKFMTNELDDFFLANGYAVIKVDVRGTGASYGFRTLEYGPPEVSDGYQIIDWVANQDWCDGNIGAYGTSYSGTMAELITSNQHSALKAVIPGWSDFDVWKGLARPYGMLMDAFISTWGQFVDLLDQNMNPFNPSLEVCPVGGTDGGAQLIEAVSEHEKNCDVYQMVSSVNYRDEIVDPYTQCSFEEISSIHYKQAIEDSGVPMLVLVSWLDAGTQDGASSGQ